MGIDEFNKRVTLIQNFAAKLDSSSLPHKIKKGAIKYYAYTLNINLTDRMIDKLFNRLMYYNS